MEQRTRKLMHKALHPRDDVDRLYVSRSEWGRGLTSIEDSIEQMVYAQSRICPGEWDTQTPEILRYKRIT